MFRNKGLESIMLIPRFRIYLNTMSLARKNKLSVPSTNLTLGGPVEAGELPLKASRQVSLHIYVP
jgi:hypothetical protein